MKSKSLLAVLAICMIWIPQAAYADAPNFCSLTFMSYNIKAAINLGPAEQGLEKIAQVIEAAGKPDVLMLQEVMRFDSLVDNIDEFQWLKDRLGYPYGYFTSGQADPVSPGTSEWGNAILLGNNAGSVISNQKYLIGWNRSLCRVTVSVQGTAVHLFCTHTGSDAIAEQVQTITGIIDDYVALGEPVILGADWNAIAHQPDMTPLRQYLEDTFIRLSLPTLYIDTFYISPEVTPIAAESVPDETHASDHDPTVCVLSPWTYVAGPAITQHPASQDRCLGDANAAFTVVATGTGTLSYQWQKDRVDLADGGRIAGATSPTLVISDLEASDINKYRCIVTDDNCSQPSNEAMLTLTPTAILTGPSDQTVGVGGSASFSAVAEGAGTLNYQWQKNETDLADDGRIVGANSANLQIGNCGSGDQGSYRCVVSGYCGTETSTAATLTVDANPPITFFEDWDDYAEGTADPAYVNRWQTMTGTSRYDVWVGNYDEFSPPNSIKVRVIQTAGISHSLADELSEVVPGADQVRGTDANPLEMLVKLYLQYTDIGDSDVFFELSMGDVHAPSGNTGSVQPVLAFGLTAGMHGSAAYPRFFDGQNWHDVTGILAFGGHNDLRMTVRTSSVQLQGERSASGSATLTRLYTGGFDRLSLRTVNNTTKWRSISDVSLTGGTIKAPLSVNAGPDKEIAIGGAAVLEGAITGGTAPFVIAWMPADGLDDPQLLEPTASPAFTTTYTLTVTDSLGGSDSDSVQVTVSGPEVPGDLDLDGDVDLEDFAVFQNCLDVPNPSQDLTCWPADLNSNDKIDGDDLTLFINCMTGPNIPGDPNCAP